MRTLVVGLGNRDRGDDGVACSVLAALRQRLGQEALTDDGEDELPGDGGLESVLLPQLAPEWLSLAHGFDRLIFVDADVRADSHELSCESVTPEWSGAGFTHHVTPGTFLALLDALHGKRPEGWLLSIRGREFDFGRRLSAQCAAQVGPAVEQILSLASGAGPLPEPSRHL